MIVVGVLIADADDTKLFGVQRPRSVVLPSLELGFDFYSDELPVEIVNDIVDLLAFQGNGVAPPFPSLVRYNRICAGFQPTHEVAIVLIDQREPPVLEVRLVEQYQPLFKPRASVELRAIVGFLVGDAESLQHLIARVMEQVEPCSSLLLIAPFELIREELVQAQHRPISNHYVPEPVELVGYGVWDSDLVEAVLDEVAEVLGQRRR